MRVVHLGHVGLVPGHPDYGNLHSHPGRWVLNLAVAQKKYGEIEPEIVVQAHKATRDYSTIIEGVPVHYLRSLHRLRALTLFWMDKRRLAAKVRQLAPDVVHAHGTEDAYGLAAMATGLPWIITAQGMMFMILAAAPAPLLSPQRAIAITERICMRRARHVVVKSDYIREGLAREFPRLEFHAIPNTFDERLLDINASREPHTVVYVGGLSRHKGVATLAEAMQLVRAEIPDVRLWMVGSSGRGGSEYNRQQAHNLRRAMGEQVEFHGVLPPTEVPGVVARAWTLVAPSLSEMFGNQLIEALLVGTHGIVSEGTALAENVRRFGNGTVVPRQEPGELAAAIVRTLRTDVFPERESARHRIQEYMGPELVARRHRELYDRILRPGRHPRRMADDST